MSEEEKPIEENPIFASPVSAEEFESELKKFREEDAESNTSDWTLAARWSDLIEGSEEVDSHIIEQIMAHAYGDSCLHTVAIRMLQLGLEIGYRLGSK